MSHLHIPDGVLPIWLWAAGWLLIIALLSLASRRLTSGDARRSLPLIGVVSALMLIAMSAEIVPLAYHLNLSVVAGVLLGPWASIISAFIVVLLLALLGHGGVTVVGLGALIIAAEMILGWALVRIGLRIFGQKHAGIASGIATIVTLALSTTMVIGVVALGGTDATARETGALDPETLHFANPFSGSVVSLVLPGSREHTHETTHTDAGEAHSALSVGRFAAVVYTLGPFGWLIEALATAGIIGYMNRVRPSLLSEGPAIRHLRKRNDTQDKSPWT